MSIVIRNPAIDPTRDHPGEWAAEDEAAALARCPQVGVEFFARLGEVHPDVRAALRFLRWRGQAAHVYAVYDAPQGFGSPRTWTTSSSGTPPHRPSTRSGARTTTPLPMRWRTSPSSSAPPQPDDGRCEGGEGRTELTVEPRRGQKPAKTPRRSTCFHP